MSPSMMLAIYSALVATATITDLGIKYAGAGKHTANLVVKIHRSVLCQEAAMFRQEAQMQGLQVQMNRLLKAMDAMGMRLLLFYICAKMR